jgi:DNA-binding transcriptional ArsR family regulator
MSARRKRTLKVRDPKQVKALRTPLRQEVVEAVTRLGACSVKELGDAVGRAPASLYYHVHELEAAGLIMEAGRRRVGKRLESVYEPVAQRIVIDRAERSEEFLSALLDLHRSSLRTAERELVRALDPGRMAGVPKARAPAMLVRLSARLRPGAAAEAGRMMRELAEFMERNDDPDTPATHALTAVLVRLVPPRESP